MGFGTVLSAAIQGIKVELIQVEADVSNGLPMFQMVGYLSSEVKEAGDRVRTAIKNSGIDLPARKTVVNLSPATIRKRGASFDLPIAVAVLVSAGLIVPERVKNILFVGELGLDGKVQKVPGVLPIVMAAKAANISTCIVPVENVREGTLVEGVQVIGTKNLYEIWKCLLGEMNWQDAREFPNIEKVAKKGGVDFQDIQGQELVKRATEIAVAGGHNLLLVGPPGSGKSMIGRRIPTILPTMSHEESMEVTQLYSIMGLLDEHTPLITERPYRSVHHTATKAALIGGGLHPVPGEISLAHEGVLFMDELPEFPRSVIEVLRQPLEEHFIQVTRSMGSYQFPAKFMLVCAMNPCPCGGYPDYNTCTCTPFQIQQYLSKVSQPFLDRMDICVEAPKVPYDVLRGREVQESSREIKIRVSKARERQKERYVNSENITNATVGAIELEKYCELGTREEELLEKAFSMLNLTARSYHKILRVARTIADLAGAEKVQEKHLKEAIGYRTIDKKYWGR